MNFRKNSYGVINFILLQEPEQSTVKQFCIKKWNQERFIFDFIRLIKLIERWQSERSLEKGSIIIHCLWVCVNVTITVHILHYLNFHFFRYISVCKCDFTISQNFRNGVERSGLFCVALYVTEQIKTPQKVDIFSAVKHVRLYRPQCITRMVRCLNLFSDTHEYFNTCDSSQIAHWYSQLAVRSPFSISLLFQEQYTFLHEFAEQYIKYQN